MRVYDISDQFRPVEVGACVPPAPKKLVDPRPNRPVVLHSADVFVDRNGMLLLHRLSGAGLYIMEYKGVSVLAGRCRPRPRAAGVRIDLARLAAIARFFPAFRARVAIFHILNETLANPGARAYRSRLIS